METDKTNTLAERECATCKKKFTPDASRAGAEHCAECSEKSGAAAEPAILNPPSSPHSPLEAAFSVAAPATAAGEFQYMPGGTYTVHLHRLGKPLTVTVQVDREGAAALQQQFEAVSSRSRHKPFMDFNHKKESASFWPTRFLWRDAPEPGIYVQGEWSKRGREAIEGKEYRAFSGTFHTDAQIETRRARGSEEQFVPAGKPGSEALAARIVCHDEAGLCFGGLVNAPAFEAIQPLFAKSAENTLPGASAPGAGTGAEGPTSPQQTKPPQQRPSRQMNEPTTLDPAALQARQTQLEQKIADLEATGGDTNAAIQLIEAKSELKELALQKELAAAKAEKAQLEARETQRKEQEADAAVEVMKSNGQIPMLDKELAASYRDKFVKDPTLIPLVVKASRGQHALEGRRTPNGNAPLVAITREANQAVLNALCASITKNREGTSMEAKKREAREFATLYAREISARLREGDPIPLEADNSFGTLSQTLVSTRTLELLTLQFPLLQAIATDMSDEIVKYGDSLYTRVVGIPSVTTYNQSTGWGASDMTTTDVSITYNQKKGVDVRIDDQSINSTVRRLFDEIAPAQAYALGKNVVDYIYALITSAFTNTVTEAGLTTFGRSTVIDIGGILDDAANPEMGRTILLNRPYFSALEKDPNITNLAAFQKSEIIERGVLPDVSGFKVIKAVNLPATVISGTKVLKGFGFTRSALVLATRLSADYINALPGAGNGRLTVITTPGGFSANQVQYVDNQLATANQRLEIIYGASRGQVAAGALLTDV